MSDLPLSLVLGVGLAAATGFRVFLPMLIMSGAAYTGHLSLDDNFAWFATPSALTMLTRAGHPVFMAGDTSAPAVISTSASVERPKIDADLSVYRHLHSTEQTIQAEKSRLNIQKIAAFRIAIRLPKPVNRI
jgi:hypothetical protein